MIVSLEPRKRPCRVTSDWFIQLISPFIFALTRRHSRLTFLGKRACVDGIITRYYGDSLESSTRVTGRRDIHLDSQRAHWPLPSPTPPPPYPTRSYFYPHPDERYERRSDDEPVPDIDRFVCTSSQSQRLHGSPRHETFVCHTAVVSLFFPHIRDFCWLIFTGSFLEPEKSKQVLFGKFFFSIFFGKFFFPFLWNFFLPFFLEFFSFFEFKVGPMENLDIALLLCTVLSLVYSCVCFFGFTGREPLKEQDYTGLAANPDAPLLQIPPNGKEAPPVRRRTGHLYVQRKWWRSVDPAPQNSPGHCTFQRRLIFLGIFPELKA